MDLEIDRLQRRGAADEGVIALGGGLPANELIPRAALSRAFGRAVSRPQCEALQYGWPEGQVALRQWVAARLNERGARVDKDDVIITNGAQQAIDLALQLVTARGDSVCCDKESYSAALDLIRSRGRRAVVGWGGARAVYVMPAVSNPGGGAMERDARTALLREAGERELIILEDDAYAELRFDGVTPRPLVADDRERVLNIGTVSKTLSPGLRVGWLVLPPALRDRALSLKHDADLQSGSLTQAVVAEYVACEDMEHQLRRARRFYSRRAGVLSKSLRQHLPRFRFEEPRGGFTIWAETDERGDDIRFLEVALRHGVSFDPGHAFRTTPSETIAIRLSFATEPEERIVEGVRRLAEAWRARGRRQSAAPKATISERH